LIDHGAPAPLIREDTELQKLREDLQASLTANAGLKKLIDHGASASLNQKDIELEKLRKEL
jgi:hypothetical protein